jgi:hypothetical protein
MGTMVRMLSFCHNQETNNLLAQKEIASQLAQQAILLH